MNEKNKTDRKSPLENHRNKYHIPKFTDGY